MLFTDTITAVSTGSGGAIAVIRVSGPDAIAVTDRIFSASSGVPLTQAEGYTLHHGNITSGNEIVDEVVISVFRAPRSYTGEDVTEISCHGSPYIKTRITQLLLENGARMASPGEFTSRAFMSGKMDLAQAEAVADLISAENRAMHELASNQSRGGYSAEFALLRNRLLELVSLLELELDFSEEEVEFADRTKLMALLGEITVKVKELLVSFRYGNVVKEGVAVAIVGNPNAGKSTLLNALVRDDRAMVSDIPGTTRDVIEESIVLNGSKYRFLDTAGIRETSDALERMGIGRTYDTIGKADMVLYLVDISGNEHDMVEDINSLLSNIWFKPEQSLAVLLNKTDRIPAELSGEITERLSGRLSGHITGGTVKSILPISAKSGHNIDGVTDFLKQHSPSGCYGGTVVYNMRHYEALSDAAASLERVGQALSSGLSGELIVQELRETLHHLGLITGEITTDEILGSIFSKFCIGK